MAEPRVDATAVERVFEDTVLLSRILWTPGCGGGPVIGIPGLCAAACVGRSWCDAVRDDTAWRPMLRAVAPSASTTDGASAYRKVVQLRRLGLAKLPANWFLQGFSVQLDVSDADGTVLACASLPLSALRFGEPHSARLEARTATDALADGGAAARFLAEGGSTRSLRLQMVLRRADGAVALLAREQRPIRVEDLDEEPEMQPATEHEIWPDADPRFRDGAVTWHSSYASHSVVSNLFNSSVDDPRDGVEHDSPAQWTWALHFPANAGAVTQLSSLELRISQRFEYIDHQGFAMGVWHNARFDGHELVAMLGRRNRAGIAEGAWMAL